MAGTDGAINLTRARQTKRYIQQQHPIVRTRAWAQQHRKTTLIDTTTTTTTIITTKENETAMVLAEMDRGLAKRTTTLGVRRGGRARCQG
jgi:alpha-ketoglutarate-dependent taurine dioxygenase